MKIIPIGSNVLVERIAADERTPGGLVIPDTAKEKPQRGKVLAAGPGKLRDDGTRTPLQVKEGDEVLFGKYSGNEVRIGVAEFIVMDETAILGVVV